MTEAGSDRFVVSSFTPAYLDPAVRRTLDDRVAAARKELARWRAEEPFLDTIEPIYGEASAAGLEVYLGQRRTTHDGG